MPTKLILCKDGGFGTQLTVHVGDQIDGDPLWSARLNFSNPDAVIKTHLDFLRAGADIILTNTYQASIQGYTKYLKLTETESIELIKSTVRLAHKAREQFLAENGRNGKNSNDIFTYSSVVLPMIIASIGPYGAHLHDGSEYTGSYADYVSSEAIKDWHKPRIDAVLEAGVDALAIETIPCQKEAEALIELLCDNYPNTKFWISLQCKDDTSLAHGESFRSAVISLWEKLKKSNATKNCLALGVNCLHPKNVTPLFESLNCNCIGNFPDKIPLVVYPNSGEVYDVKTGWHGKEDCIPLDHYVPEWLNLGAKIIGGCCRNYDRDIRRIKETIDKISKLNNNKI